jgi:dephospho-CoA kinase
MSPRPFLIGVTGNIATGKSTVIRMLADLGACVIDADRVAQDLMRAGTAMHRAVVERFGADIVGGRGEIDRRLLGAIVFADPAALSDLDALVHPAVRVETRHLAQACTGPVVAIEAVKLFEAGMDADCDSVWVVTAPRAIQITRLELRSGLTREQAELRVDAQSPQADKAARADIVIDNASSLACTHWQVVRAWERTVRPEAAASPEAPK